MRAEFVPSTPTFPDQIRIGVRETPGNKNRGLERPSITEIQQAFQPNLGTRDPVHIDGEVPWRGCLWTHAMSIVRSIPPLRENGGRRPVITLS
jgi:hypothetical protein